jgi:hypothetical protein
MVPDILCHTQRTLRGTSHACPLPTAAAVSLALCFPHLAAGRTALGLIGEAFGCVEFLLASTEGEGSPQSIHCSGLSANAIR